MATPSVMAADILPRFLLPRLSWAAPLSAPRAAARPFAAIHVGKTARQFSSFQHGESPAQRRPTPAGSPILILSRAFHATAMRQRDHHFDTLKFVKRLQSEGFTELQSVAMMKVLNDVIEESIQNLTRTMVLREDAAKATYTQKVDFAKLRSELLSADSTESNTTRSAHERLTNDIAKLSSRLRDEIGRTQASVRLDLNLEKGRIREEAVGQELKSKETETKIEQEVAALREKLEQVKFQTLQWLMGVCTGFAALLLGAWRLLIKQFYLNIAYEYRKCALSLAGEPRATHQATKVPADNRSHTACGLHAPLFLTSSIILNLLLHLPLLAIPQSETHTKRPERLCIVLGHNVLAQLLHFSARLFSTYPTNLWIRNPSSRDSTMAGKPKVLLLGKIDHSHTDITAPDSAHDAWSGIADIAQVLRPEATNRDEFFTECKAGAFDGASVAYRTFDSVAVTGKIDSAVLDVLPKSLKFLCHNGAGYDQVDIPACTAHNVRVSNTPTAVDDATADITIWLLIGALRNLPASMAALRAGNWRGKSLPALGHDPQGKVLGILGMGGIGRNVAAKARAFGMRIRYHNRSRLSPDLEDGAEYVDFETLLKQSDVLSLNLPLNPKTRHTISTPQFAIMKPGIVIVNTARGAVMDEAALVDALATGQVASVGLDVYENEPEIHAELLANESVLLVPHMGTWTEETQTKMEEWAISNVRMAVTEAKLRSIVPEQTNMA
ncbi:putative 2-hydroxyacid dehydrogenase UNK4.10 [Tolypocladium ophioglossoides CBS 100239]|uniref:Putative 2-hydroxyacid dehydrogenase UNK4.10 n=1 Tax=Tolypocladium ophioglossoides (strain CBS 100239) TaxID=1163406 RepID=A0A0L0NEK6_TOLOC|nr:putative 2-hydroxyacid dehydrogenase UNK4.10 [Tolypocladium ophioglossoides CBS 100239]